MGLEAEAQLEPLPSLVALTDLTSQKKAEIKAQGAFDLKLGSLQQQCSEVFLALHASQERMRPFFQSQILGMALTSPEKGWLQVNDTLCEFLGYSSAELLRMNWAELTHPDDLSANVQLFEQMLSGEIDSLSLETRFVRKDGEVAPAKLSIQCVRRADRSVDCALVLVEDIRERRQLETESLAIKTQLREQNLLLQASQQELERRVAERTAELSASNQQLRAEVEAHKQTEAQLRQAKEFAEGFIHALPDLSLEISREGRYLNVWAQSPELLALHKKTLLGKTVYEALSPEAAKIFMSVIREAEVIGCSSGKVISIAHAAFTRWFELSAAKYPGGDSAKGSVIVLSREVTHRKQAEEALVLREREFRTLADNLPDCIIRYDGQGRKTYLNPAVSGFFADASALLIGQTPEESLAATASGACPKEISSALRRVLASGEPEEIEVSVENTVGARQIHSIRFIVERGVDGGGSGVLLIGHDITERKLYERSLLARAEQGQQLSNIAANLPGFVFTFRALPENNFTFPFVSPGIQQLLGLAPGDLAVGLAPLLALITQDARSAILNLIAKSLREMSVFRWTGSFNVQRDEGRWIEVHAMPHREADGGVLWYGVMLDVTEQREMEQQLLLTRFALDQTLEAFYLIGADQRFVYVNEEACRALGYCREELLGLSLCDVDPDVALGKGRTVSDVLSSNGGSCFETRHQRRDGSVFSVEVRTTLFEYQGQIFAAGLARDLTEQKRAEKSIAAREREFRTLAQSLPDNIIRYDRNGIVVYINAALERTLGGCAADIIGVRVREWFGDGRFEIYAQTLDSVLATGIDREIEIFMPDPRVHSDVIHQIRFVAERDENSDVVGVLAIGRDISALKRSEHELEVSRGQLRGLVAHREEALEAERKRIAREVHDELGQVLTGLQMKLSRLARKCERKCSVPGDDLHDALMLSETALGVARNVATSLRPAVLDMGIASALEWLADRFATDSGIRCHLHIGDEDIQLNENQAIALFRTTQESLTNVARHARADRVDIVLAKSEDEYVLRVQDNGVGFDSAIKKLGSFGLVGIQERALMLGGAAVIDSCLGGGTEVVVRIPIQERQVVL